MLLNELQLRYQSNMPRRMRTYAALAEEKYQLNDIPRFSSIFLKLITTKYPQTLHQILHGLGNTRLSGSINTVGN